MVYDWFNRQASDDSSTEQSLEQKPVGSQTGSSDSISQQEESASINKEEDSLEWARQAYARLKAQQEQQKPSEVSIESDLVGSTSPSVNASPEASNQPSVDEDGGSWLEQAASQRQARQQDLETRVNEVSLEPHQESQPPETSSQANLGEFDETFTWSAEVLAAQGRQVEQISLEEIDWLGRLRRGLEKTRQGFVRGLLENLGDDPRRPEVLDDLETLLLRADAGVEATDQVLDALRARMNEEVVDPAEGLRFLKQQLCNLLEVPIKATGIDLLAPERGRLNIWLLVGVNGVAKPPLLASWQIWPFEVVTPL